MKRAIRSALLCLGIAVLCRPATPRAQVAAVNELRLSLGECVEIALQNNTQLAVGRYQRDIADAQVDNSRNAFLPNLSSGWSMSRGITGPREGATIDPTTGLLITTLGESRTSGSQRVSGSMNMTVYNPRDWANLSASRKGLKASEMDLADRRQQVVFQVNQAYFNLLKAKKLLGVQQEQVRVSEESFRRNKTLYEIGSAPVSNVLSAQSDLERNRATLIQRENAVEINRSSLSYVMGLGPDVRVTLTEEVFEVGDLPITYEEALDRSLKGHPAILSDKYSMLQSRDQLRATRYGVRHPTASMSASYGWTLGQDEKYVGVEDLFMKNYSYRFGLSVSLPVFNRLSTENNVKIQKLRYLQSLENLDQAKRQRAQDIKQSFLNLETLRRSRTAYQAAVRASEETFNLQSERYKLGAGTFLEQQTAQLNLFNTRSQLVQTEYDYHIELARLTQQVGGPIVADREE